MSQVAYPYLPVGQEIRYVSADHPYMVAAQAICQEESSDRLQPTGAVVALGGMIIARAANQAALCHPRWRGYHARGWCLRRVLKIKSGEKYWLCPGCASPDDHAESRAARLAMARARQDSLDLSNAELYLWGHWWCCALCWAAIIEAGIGEIYLLEGSEVLFNRAHPDNRIGQ